MDNDELSAIGRNVDLNEIPSIPQKQTVTFINYYLSRSVQLLNEISASAERRLERALEQLQQLEAGVCLLEGKLNSIPGLTDGVTLEPEPETPTTSMEVITEQPLPQAQPGGSTEVTFSAASSETELGQKSDPTDETLNE
ncbi:WASH complex subunit 3-like [Varroa jacobsoni]|uniref:Uncharacterized protein n=1 Tax=Varroa destructor TaxID=109461 RepID=A0A7M7L0P5_VARDE|nr:WASH complex subunit 3-like [Varroa destructor]XP_022668397.1 WASH complex subunit 3-like [Varroa destructor]XP_022668398.1 WASH complex subunit 3-like [Varroa destructor]XP_022698274.1 WASH complex subunit 3-like [Varroa jacobsoni]XP_022698275.1 WASH complex subunit 3-like [Varroa jacobsoni]XP_022698276.1 WASH complex subunit 3-like [Varroa jacobsoni]